MKLKKRSLSNFIFIVLLGLLLFTPVGFHMRVFVNRILLFSPSILDEKKQVVLTDYDWQLSNTNGEVFDFKNAKGKVVLVNFWATWCPPCVAEMPSLQDLYDEYGEKIEFILIARDEKISVKDFLTKKEYSIPVYFENTSTPKCLSAESIPTTFVIDKGGKVIVRKNGSAQWNGEAIRKVLDNLLKSS